MMSFGWRSMLSCYASQDDQMAGAVTSAQQAAEMQAAPAAAAQCSKNPTWFYALLAIAAAAGLAHGGKR